jgi:hypothetical protein
VRAGDLIGQLGDPLYPRKLNALYYEFAETGVHEKLGYRSPSQGLRRNGGKGRSQQRFNQGRTLRRPLLGSISSSRWRRRGCSVSGP